VPTRLVGGPLVFRIQGAIEPTPANGTPQLRYVLIFRLNREIHLPERLRNARSGPYPPGARGSWGNFTLDGEDYLYDNPVLPLDPVDRTNDHDNCFSGEIRSDDPTTRRLDRIPLGGHVRVRLRPLTPKPGGSADAILGIIYVRDLRMLSMRVKPDAATGYYNQVASRSARTRLARIGCAETALDPANG
jgi:hypothetical protein